MQKEKLKRTLATIGNKLNDDIPSIIYVDKEGTYVLLCTRVPYAEYMAGLNEMAGRPHLNLVEERNDDEPIH